MITGVTISQELLKALLESAREAHPNEIVLLLRAEKADAHVTVLAVPVHNNTAWIKKQWLIQYCID